MKRALFIAAVAVFSTAMAAEPLTNAKVENNYEAAPKVLPGSPTAAVTAPKYSMIVPCTLDAAGKAACIDVAWPPVLGPAEYVLMPFKKQEPVVVEKLVPGPTVIKEVPAKPIKE
jgi:hypothetical protein